MSLPKTHTQILDWMSANPEPHNLGVITEATGTTKAAAKRALASLTKDGHVTADGDGEDTTWQHASTNDTNENTSATDADQAHDSEGDSTMNDQPANQNEPSTTKQPLQPDPTVLLVARTMAELNEPATVEAIAEKSFMSADSKQVLWALCALAAHEALTCSHPLKPETATWETSVAPGEVMDIASRTQTSDAPSETACHECGHTTALPSPNKRRGRNGTPGVRLDGTPVLEPGGLRKRAIAWINENPGELFKPRDLNRELRSIHGDIISNHDGAIRALLESLLLPKNGELVEVADKAPLTYRATPNKAE